MLTILCNTIQYYVDSTPYMVKDFFDCLSNLTYQNVINIVFFEEMIWYECMS